MYVFLCLHCSVTVQSAARASAGSVVGVTDTPWLTVWSVSPCMYSPVLPTVLYESGNVQL